MSMQELDSDASIFVVNSLQKLRESLEAEGSMDIVLYSMLSDVCKALGLLPEERGKVVGGKLVKLEAKLLAQARKTWASCQDTAPYTSEE